MTHEQPKRIEDYMQDCGMNPNPGNSANMADNAGQTVSDQQAVPQTTLPYEPISPKNPNKITNAAKVGVAAIVAVGALMLMRSCDTPDAGIVKDAANTPEQDGGIASAACGNTWAVHELDNTGHRIISTGIESIRTASTPDEARQAAYDFIEITKGDPDVVAANAKAFLGEDVERDSLVDTNGCMTEGAEQLVLRTAIAIGDSEVTPDQAPANGVNSGVNVEGTVVEASAAGISGDRKAIKIVLKDGTTFWIMHRCGNFVKVGGKLFYKQGPTDNEYNPEETTTTSTVPAKYDDGRLPGNPNVPADQDKGTPDLPGVGPAGQTPGPDGYLPQETRPQAPSTAPDQTQAPTTTGRPTASTTPAPTSTNPPVTATTSVSTTVPQNKPRPTQP